MPLPAERKLKELQERKEDRERVERQRAARGKASQDMVKQADEIENPKEEVIPQNRAAAALQLRIDGAGWGDIAKILEFKTNRDAQIAVESALANEAKSVEDVDQVRFLEARRMERILSSLMRRATNPSDPDHLAYARTAMVVIDRHTKLYGADAPQKLNVTYNPAAGQIEQWVSAMARQVHGELEEADILDVEVIDDVREDS
jgi:hypothetical protein